jgi:hypothetical protein
MIKDDFSNYIDGNGLNTPAPCVPVPDEKGSDNAPCFTSEMYLIISKNGQLTQEDAIDYFQKMEECINPQDMLCRVPMDQKDSQEGPDDYLSVLNCCHEIGNTEIPRQFLWATLRYLGFLNNVNPGTLTAVSFLIRQPQIVAAMVAAAFPSFRNPLHWVARFFALPLFFIAAISISISCINDPISDTDSRRLAWHLSNNTKRVSLMCWLASKIWLRRLHNDYGPTGMQAVAALYYSPNGNNPYQKWWVT